MKIERLKSLIENPKYTKKKIKLADGRKLSYSECGNTETGIPVIFCFGLMTSSVAIMFAHHVALQNNLRILAVDYPGIGESTYQENRTLAGWGDDMVQFCDKVLGKNSEIRLLGHSLGGMHVLALLTNKAFKKRVVRSILLCPWTYLEGDEFNPSWMNFARTLPDVVQRRLIPPVLTNLSTGSMFLVGWSNPSHLQVQAAKLVTSYATLQGNKGNEQMVRLALSKSKKTYMPRNLDHTLMIYHGTKDNLVLEKSVKELQRILEGRNCRTKFISVPGGDHNSILADEDNLSNVLSAIVGEPDAWAAEVIKSLRGKTRSLPVQPGEAPSKSKNTASRRKGKSLSPRLRMAEI